MLNDARRSLPLQLMLMMRAGARLGPSADHDAHLPRAKEASAMLILDFLFYLRKQRRASICGQFARAWYLRQLHVFLEPRNGQNPPRQQMYAGDAGCPTALMPEAPLDGRKRGPSWGGRKAPADARGHVLTPITWIGIIFEDHPTLSRPCRGSGRL